jgi:hypothetical protein
VIIDLQSNTFYVSYKRDAHFDASILRGAANLVEARLPLIQIKARGYIREESSKHYLVAGPDRFLLMEPPAPAPPLPPPSDKELSVVASVDDSGDPIRVKIIQYGPAEAKSAKD